ncbi:MAG: DUF1080 domain-containing protein [Anaerolineae bacterium]|nr:DUF1080 domain-containing protein [Anaerolineae bacterium]
MFFRVPVQNRSLLLLALLAIVGLAAACNNPTPTPGTVYIVVTATPDGSAGGPPPSPAPGETLLQENFDDEIADGWRTEGGAWGIQQREYEQTYIESNNPVWSTYPGLGADDYSFQADIKLVPEGYNAGNSRTAGLAVRMIDANHFYYVALDWKEQTLTLYRVNGNSRNPKWLGSRPYSLAEDAWYKVSVVAHGPFLRVYVDDVSQIEVTDETHGSGSIGLRVSGGHFRIDNVQVDSVPALPEARPPLPFDDAFDDADSDGWWKVNGAWRTADGALEQSSLDSQVWAYQPNRTAADYRLMARVQPDAGVAGAVGVSLRMNGPSNGYWAVVDHGAGEMQIILRVRDNTTVIASRPVSLDAIDAYTLTFEAVGQSLRLKLDDGPTLEASDGTFTAGYLGLWFKSAAARIDDVRAEEIALAMPAQVTLPFTDDFEDGYAEDWYKASGGWGVVEGTFDQGQFAPGTTASAWVDINERNYAMTARVRLMPENYTDKHDRVLGLRIRNVDDKRAYVVSINMREGMAQFWYGDGQNWYKISDPVPASFNMSDWNTVRIEAYESQLRFRLNGDLILSASDDRLRAGGFGFRIRDGHFQIDDVRAEAIDR